MPYGSLALDEISTSGNLAIVGNVTATGNLTVASDVISTNASHTTIRSLSANTTPVIRDSIGTETGQFVRAWVNFDGTTTPPTIRASFNVSSVSRSATGQYQATLTNALVDANGCVVAQARILGTGSAYCSSYMDTASTIQINTNTTTGALASANQIHVAVFR